MTPPTINDPRSHLRHGELVEYKGKFYRVCSLPQLKPSGQPGLHRVSYWLQPPLQHSDGTITFGFYHHIEVKATKLELTVTTPGIYKSEVYDGSIRIGDKP